jgi:8-oxo-dGTP pyrophosphatase MutT (NUDIX family)
MTHVAERGAEVSPLDIKHDVVRAVLPNRLGQVVLLQRLPTKGYQRNHFEFPGGKIEPGEDPMDALVREVWEETGLEIELCAGPDDPAITMVRLMKDVGRYIRTTTRYGNIIGGQYMYDPAEHQQMIVATPADIVRNDLPLTDECYGTMLALSMLRPQQQAA